LKRSADPPLHRFIPCLFPLAASDLYAYRTLHTEYVDQKHYFTNHTRLTTEIPSTRMKTARTSHLARIKTYRLLSDSRAWTISWPQSTARCAQFGTDRPAPKPNNSSVVRLVPTMAIPVANRFPVVRFGRGCVVHALVSALTETGQARLRT
jgi:hypothetical protein